MDRIANSKLKVLFKYCECCWKVTVPKVDQWKTIGFALSHKSDLPNQKRPQWHMKIDFLFSCLGYAIGLGNIWRFPFKVLSNGGGTFIIAYLFMLCILAMPLFLIEIIISQFSSRGVTECWCFAIGLRGIGFSMLIMSFFCSIYYNLIVGWSIYYFINSCRSVLPWTSCENWWNDNKCVRSDFSGILKINKSMEMSSEQFWLRNVITRIETIDGNTSKVLTISDSPQTIVWYSALCMLVPWLVCAGIIMFGIKVSGKAMWFFSMFPYVVIIIMVILGSSLDGSSTGVKFYVSVDFKNLMEFKIWIQAAEQIFYSLGVGFGGMITYGSYNKFDDKIQRNVLLVSFFNSGTSIFAAFAVFELLGNMAYRYGEEFKTMSKFSGDGLIFIAYPEVLSTFKGAHVLCLLFFAMIFSLGIDTQMAIIETFITGIMDEFPVLRSKRTITVWIAHLLCYLLALIMVTKTGFSWFVIFSNYAVAINLLAVGFCESVAISFIYGIGNLNRDFRMMSGFDLNLYWKISMLVPVPIITIVLLCYSIIRQERTTLGSGYHAVTFPVWADAFGWFIFTITLLPIPIYFIYYMINMKFENKASLKTALQLAFLPNINWGPALKENWMLDEFYKEKYETLKDNKNFNFYETKEDSIHSNNVTEVSQHDTI